MTSPASCLPLLLIVPLAAHAGCTATDADPQQPAAEARIAEDGDEGPAERAWYQTASGLSYEAFRPIDGVDRLHHLDVDDHSTGTLVLVPGTSYVDGPAVNGRGFLSDHVGPDGLIEAGAPSPWIDLITCDGDILVEPSGCRQADRIELVVETVTGGAQRVTYRATMPGDAEPTVSGSFVAAPDQLHGTP